jgi:hypothetical protein
VSFGLKIPLARQQGSTVIGCAHSLLRKLQISTQQWMLFKVIPRKQDKKIPVIKESLTAVNGILYVLTVSPTLTILFKLFYFDIQQ